MKKYYAYMKTTKGYEKLGISCYSTSRKKAAMTFAAKKNISLKDWLKSYNVVSNNEIIEKITFHKTFIEFKNYNEILSYKFDFKKDRFLPTNSNAKNLLSVEKFISFLSFMKKDGYQDRYITINTVNEYDYPTIN